MQKDIFLKERAPYIITFLYSVLFSFIAIAFDNFINNDGVYYIDAAKIFLREGLKASFDAYPWPFYSILIALVHTFTGLPLEPSAHLINTLLLASSCVLFVKLHDTITDHKGSLWIAVVLTLAFPGINNYREDIMRDFGFWCFFLVAFLSILSFYKQPRLLTALGWQLSILLAFLFRVEAISMAVLGPFIMVLKQASLKRRLYEIFSLYSLYPLCIMSFLLLWYALDISIYDMPLGRLNTITDHLSIGKYISPFNNAISQLGTIFHYDAARTKYYYVLVFILLVTIMSYAVIKIAARLSILYAVALFYGLYKRRLVLNTNNKIVLYFALINFLMILLFICQNHYVMPRHTTCLVFMLLLLIAQILKSLLPEIRKVKRHKIILAGLMALLLIQTGDSLISIGGTSKTHLKSAGQWIGENVKDSKNVVANDIQAMYYTDRGYSSRYAYETERIFNRIESNRLRFGTFVILYVPRHKAYTINSKVEDLIDKGKLVLIKEFCNTKKDRTVVFQVSPPSSKGQ